jgi:hypothetical protein
MKIHEAQRAAFRAQAEETFPHRVRALLAARLPEERQALETDEGLDRVRALIAEARELGFDGERDACKYVVLSFVVGEDFIGEPWAARILADDRLETPTDRAEALWDTAKRRERDQAVTETARALG